MEEVGAQDKIGIQRTVLEAVEVGGGRDADVSSNGGAGGSYGGGAVAVQVIVSESAATARRALS